MQIRQDNYFLSNFVYIHFNKDNSQKCNSHTLKCQMIKGTNIIHNQIYHLNKNHKLNNYRQNSKSCRFLEGNQDNKCYYRLSYYFRNTDNYFNLNIKSSQQLCRGNNLNTLNIRGLMDLWQLKTFPADKCISHNSHHVLHLVRGILCKQHKSNYFSNFPKNRH